MGLLGNDEDNMLRVSNTRRVGSCLFRWDVAGFWYNTEKDDIPVLVFPPNLLDRKGWVIFLANARIRMEREGEHKEEDILRFVVSLIEDSRKKSSAESKIDFDDPG